jgi:simple sugar transport system ATP-binding protein
MSTIEQLPVDTEPGGGDKIPLIELKHVGKQYGNIIALQDINLRVRAGEVTGVLGDNGAGKSTLIKIIAGLHQQSEGELLVDGEALTFGSPKEALSKGIVYAQWNPDWFKFFLGLMLLLATIVNLIVKRRAELK